MFIILALLLSLLGLSLKGGMPGPVYEPASILSEELADMLPLEPLWDLLLPLLGLRNIR